MDLARIVEIAKAQAAANVREVGGANRGPQVETYLKAAGMSPGSPWCAAFVAWVIREASGQAKAPRWATASAVTNFFNAQTKLRGTEFLAYPHERGRVKAGWIWVRAASVADAEAARGRKWTRGHTGIVTSPDGAGFATVEGNTNKAGSRDGDGVYSKSQSWTDPRTLGFFDPVALSAAYLPQVKNV